VKLHTPLDLLGSIPTNVYVTGGPSPRRQHSGPIASRSRVVLLARSRLCGLCSPVYLYPSLRLLTQGTNSAAKQAAEKESGNQGQDSKLALVQGTAGERVGDSDQRIQLKEQLDRLASGSHLPWPGASRGTRCGVRAARTGAERRSATGAVNCSTSDTSQIVS
jgi:hypothetical protein